MRSSYTIIGLGIFGSTAAIELTRLGYDVLGIDQDAGLVNEWADQITQTVVADARNEHVLRDLGVANSDIVLIAIGKNLEASILATLIIKSMNKPKVWVKARDSNHHRILEKIGADHVVHPEYEVGLRLAHTLMYHEVMDYIDLGDGLYAVEIHASQKLAGQTLDALCLHAHNLRCVLIKQGKKLIVPPLPHHFFHIDDRLILVGTLSSLRRISKYL